MRYSRLKMLPELKIEKLAKKITKVTKKRFSNHAEQVSILACLERIFFFLLMMRDAIFQSYLAIFIAKPEREIKQTFIVSFPFYRRH